MAPIAPQSGRDPGFGMSNMIATVTALAALELAEGMLEEL
jgi:hypothetical protein